MSDEERKKMMNEIIFYFQTLFQIEEQETLRNYILDLAHRQKDDQVPSKEPQQNLMMLVMLDYMK